MVATSPPAFAHGAAVILAYAWRTPTEVSSELMGSEFPRQMKRAM
jgi:hypothetical protein